MTEHWIDLIGYGDYYEISNLFNIRRKQNTTNRKVSNLKRRVHTGGYEYIQITINNKSKNLTYHRLIAQHFIPNPLDKPFVNHKDGNKLNNSIENLEWCTASENMIHCFATGLQKGRKGESHHNAKLSKSDVLKIREMFKNNKSIDEVHYIFNNVGRNHIIAIKNNKTWKNI